MFAFLRCGSGFERIVMPNYYPTTKRMAANSSGHVAGRFGVLQQLQQFVNSLQQFSPAK